MLCLFTDFPAKYLHKTWDLLMQFKWLLVRSWARSIATQYQKALLCFCKPKGVWVKDSQLFFLQAIELQVHLQAANRLQVYPVKTNKLLVSWSLFWSQKSPRLLSPRILTWAHQDQFHAQNPSFLPLQPQWQLNPPQGILINYGWMFDWQRLNDRSSVLTRLPHTENLVPIVLF